MSSKKPPKTDLSDFLSESVFGPSDSAWNVKRVELEAAVVSASKALAAHTGASSMTLPSGTLTVKIETHGTH